MCMVYSIIGLEKWREKQNLQPAHIHQCGCQSKELTDTIWKNCRFLIGYQPCGILGWLSQSWCYSTIFGNNSLHGFNQDFVLGHLSLALVPGKLDSTKDNFCHSPSITKQCLYCNESSKYEYSKRKSVFMRVHQPVS